MIYYGRTDISEGIHVNKVSKSKECNICHYWFSLKEGFKFQPFVCNRNHYLIIMSMNLRDILHCYFKYYKC